MVSIPHNAQTSSLEESDKLEATKELIEVEWRKMKETDDSVIPDICHERCERRACKIFG